MVEIRFFLNLLNHYFSGFLRFFVILSLFPAGLHAQVAQQQAASRKAIELTNADIDFIENDSITGNDIHRLTGNVSFLHNKAIMSCDSAHYRPQIKQIIAFSRVHINQGDTLNLYSNYLFYDGRTETAIAKGNVELVDKKTHLYTDTINYDVRNRVASLR